MCLRVVMLNEMRFSSSFFLFLVTRFSLAVACSSRLQYVPSEK